MRFCKGDLLSISRVDETDEETNYRVNVLNVATIASIFLIVLIILGNLLGGRIPAHIYIIDISILAATIVMRILLFRGKFTFVAFSFIFLILFFLTTVIASLGTIRTPSTAIYCLLVMLSGVLFRMKGIIITTAASSLAVGGLILAENAGILPTPDFTVTITQWITYSVIFFLAGTLVYGESQVAQRVKEMVTTRKQMENELQTSEASFHSLFEQTHDAVFLLDLEGRHIMANHRAADMLGYSLDELRHLSVNDTSAEIKDSHEIIHRLLAGETIPIYERLFRKKDGGVLPVEISVELVKDKNETPVHIQSVVRDISQRKKAEEALKSANEQLNMRMNEVVNLQTELREQALHDPLTGLFNRRYLNEILKMNTRKADFEEGALSIIAIDIDHFKEINDVYGHQIGDEFLVKIAEMMRNNTRPSDICCRFGGDEFLILLPGVTSVTAQKRAEYIRQACNEVTIQHDGTILRVTMSMGISSYPEHGMDLDALLIKADKALYLSKQNGRNQTTIWYDESLKE